MIFVPSWRIIDIEELNPSLNMETTAVPQTPSTTSTKVNWASFWMEGVSRDSQHSKVAWDFLKYMSDRESQLKYYSLATQLRSFGEPYARVDLAENLGSHKYLGPLLAGAPTATTWFITDYSGNDPYTEIIQAAINKVVSGGPTSAGPQLKLTQEALTQLAEQNNVVVE